MKNNIRINIILIVKDLINQGYSVLDLKVWEQIFHKLNLGYYQQLMI